MESLIRYQKYSRKSIHDIFSPDTVFKVGAGAFGMSGIIRVPNTQDFLFLVTIGQKYDQYQFDESIDEMGVLIWQSQPKQKLSSPQILSLIHHDASKNKIHLFLRTTSKEDYSYIGELQYITHDNMREMPVHFKWQILDFEPEKVSKIVPLRQSNLESFVNEFSASDFHEVSVQNENKKKSSQRQGIKTSQFYSYRNVDFEKNFYANTLLGVKGEEIVKELEQKKLMRAGRTDLMEKVFRTEELAGNAEKFDVISYDEFGNPMYIEVKTTTAGIHAPFYISESEVQFSIDHPDNYYLYRIYDLNLITMTYKIQKRQGSISREKLTTDTYKADFGNL